MQRLKDIEQQVISEHYYKGHNQTEIAKQLGISCNYVSHILRNGTKKLKKILATEEIRDTQMQRALVAARPRSGDASYQAGSVIDSATGVYNHHYFEQRLEEEVSRACRHRCKLALMLVDICLPDDVDRYLRVVRIDDVLYSAAQCMRAAIRKMDVLARFGQTSFALMLPHTASHATIVAERISEIISSIEIESGRKATRIGATARVGIAKYPAEAGNYRDMLDKACQDMGVTASELLGEDATPLKKAA